MAIIIDPTNPSHFPTSAATAIQDPWERTVVGWETIDGSKVKSKVTKLPSVFKVDLKSKVFTLQPAVLSMKLGYAKIGEGNGKKFPAEMLNEYPLGKDFLGLGKVFAVHRWSKQPHVIFKVAHVNDGVYRYYAIIDGP